MEGRRGGWRENGGVEGRGGGWRECGPNKKNRYGLILTAPIEYPAEYFSPPSQDFLSHLLERDPKARSTPSLMKVNFFKNFGTFFGNLASVFFGN
jgi:hypothetical protein